MKYLKFLCLIIILVSALNAKKLARNRRDYIIHHQHPMGPPPPPPVPHFAAPVAAGHPHGFAVRKLQVFTPPQLPSQPHFHIPVGFQTMPIIHSDLQPVQLRDYNLYPAISLNSVIHRKNTFECNLTLQENTDIGRYSFYQPFIPSFVQQNCSAFVDCYTYVCINKITNECCIYEGLPKKPEWAGYYFHNKRENFK
jgi:hypothetical protein